MIMRYRNTISTTKVSRIKSKIKKEVQTTVTITDDCATLNHIVITMSIVNCTI